MSFHPASTPASLEFTHLHGVASSVRRLSRADFLQQAATPTTVSEGVPVWSAQVSGGMLAHDRLALLQVVSGSDENNSGD